MVGNYDVIRLAADEAAYQSVVDVHPHARGMRFGTSGTYLTIEGGPDGSRTQTQCRRSSPPGFPTSRALGLVGPAVLFTLYLPRFFAFKAPFPEVPADAHKEYVTPSSVWRKRAVAGELTIVPGLRMMHTGMDLGR